MLIDNLLNQVHCANCIDFMKQIADCEIDTIITDPPYGLAFMGKSWDSFNSNKELQEWTEEWAIEALRVIKPGGIMLCFAGCYDEDTEILTDEGWKYFKNLNKAEKVATLDPETEEIEYQKPIDYINKEYKGEMYKFSSNKVNLLVTPNHKLLTSYLGHRKRKWKLIRADKANKAIRMKKNGKWIGKEELYFTLPATKQSNGHYINKIPEKKIPMDLWLKFFGLWIAEGSSTITKLKKGNGKGYNTQICHFNNNNLDELESELEQYFNICRYKESGKFRINDKQLAEYLQQFGKAWGKYIPKTIKNLSSRQLKILLRWYMKGDGDDRNRAYTCSEQLRNDLQEIALKIGISADYYKGKKKNGNINGRVIKQKHTQWQIAFNKTQNEPEVYQANKKKQIKSIVNYSGRIYCVEVPKYHTLYVRRNGKSVWSGNTRTQHRIACGIEDAGWIIKDTIMWIYGSGFPKSHNIGKAVEKEKVGGIKNLKQIGTKEGIKVETGTQGFSYSKEYVAGKCMGGKQISGDIPVYEINNKWKNYGTALKPAYEPIIMAMKPKDGTYAENALKWNVAGLNIDGARIQHNEDLSVKRDGHKLDTNNQGWGFKAVSRDNKGRFPANLILEDCEEVVECFPYTKSGFMKAGHPYGLGNGQNVYGELAGKTKSDTYGDSGSASRYFKRIKYCAKASKKERNRGLEDKSYSNDHPTIKPVELLEYLVELTKMPNEEQVYLDPFLGSGSTAIAVCNKNRNYIGIEKNAEYCQIARARIKENRRQLQLF